MRKRLLERIADLEIPSPTGVTVPHEVALKLSIINYLERLLNSRRGESPIDPYYGLSNMANVAGTLVAESSLQLESDLVEQIQLYEKRFTQPSIARIVDEKYVTDFRYELRGMVNIAEIGDEMRQFVVVLKLNSSGRFNLEEKRGF